MEKLKSVSLIDYVQDNFVPQKKVIPERITKELLLECEQTHCTFCDSPLYSHYTSNSRLLVTVRFNLWLRVEYVQCLNPDCFMHQNKISIHNPELERFMLYDHRYALDITFLIGHLIYKENYTEQKVVTYLLENHGIAITQPDVNHYKRIALAISEATLICNAEKVRKGLDALPFRVYSIDGTNSNFSKTLFIVRDLISGMVLGVAMLTEHDKDTIHQFLEAIFGKFGRPDYLVGDGERGLIAAARLYYMDIPFQYCQQHFLKNLGKALMEETAKSLNKLQKKNI
jgi:hypothetical protein